MSKLILQKNCHKEDLIHITAESRLDSILKCGICASQFGDLEVDGNDGYGVYAVKNIAVHPDLLDIIALDYCNEPIYGVVFEPAAEWYECIEDPSEDPYHVGYVVVPYSVMPENIKKIQFLGGVLYA